MKNKFDFSEKTPTYIIKRRLIQARRTKKIYLIARVIQVLRDRGCLWIKLTRKEQRRLWLALYGARHNNLPLAAWIPCGYQIVRLMMLVMDLIPQKRLKITDNDIRLINLAAREFGADSKLWSKSQIPSLELSARSIGLVVKRGKISRTQ